MQTKTITIITSIKASELKKGTHVSIDIPFDQGYVGDIADDSMDASNRLVKLFKNDQWNEMIIPVAYIKGAMVNIGMGNPWVKVVE